MDTKQVQKIINPMIQQIRTSAFVPEYQDAASMVVIDKIFLLVI